MNGRSPLAVAPPEPLAKSTLSAGGIGELKREFADSLVSRSRWLPAADRALVLALFEQGRPVSEIAAAWGKNSRAVRARARAIALRACSREFAFVVLHRGSWDSVTRAVAEACILRGQSIQATCSRLGLSRYQVRRRRDAVLAMCAGAGGPERPRGRQRP